MLTEIPSARGVDSKIEDMTVRAFRIPTETPEADGTLEWDETTLVLVQLKTREAEGLGFTYADIATAHFIDLHLRDPVLGTNPFDIPKCHAAMTRRIRNLGRPGVAAMAISAVDIALWDLKARLLNLPLARLFGECRGAVPLYGSGGFTNYSLPQLQQQMKQWADQKMPFVKMKIGADPSQDVERVRAVRNVIGGTPLFVDANGAYSCKQALDLAQEFDRLGVRWLEEPVSSDDLAGLRLIRSRAPAGIAIAAGEYAYDLVYLRRMLEAEAVDVLQIDVTRCGGYTVLIQGAALAQAFGIPVSTHCAPSLHLPAAAALPYLQHVEYFFDHVRIEQMLFDGAIRAERGQGRPSSSAPGHGLRFREREAAPYAAYPA